MYFKERLREAHAHAKKTKKPVHLHQADHYENFHDAPDPRETYGSFQVHPDGKIKSTILGKLHSSGSIDAMKKRPTLKASV